MRGGGGGGGGKEKPARKTRDKQARRDIEKRRGRREACKED
jgi:hypothetical protein